MNSREGVKLVIWDLDGTIIDSDEVYDRCSRELAMDRGYDEPTEEQLRATFHGSLSESLGELFSVTSDEEQFILEMRFLQLQADHYANPDEHVLKDALRLAERFDEQGAYQVVATNRAHEGRGLASPYNIINNSQMGKFITEIFAGDEVAFRKPDARVLGDLLNKRDVEGDQILVVGDQFVDAQLAANIGSDCILVNRSDHPTLHLEKLDGNLGHITQVSLLDEVQL